MSEDRWLTFPVSIDPSDSLRLIDSAGKHVATLSDAEHGFIVTTTMNAGIVAVDVTNSDLRQIIRAMEQALAWQTSRDEDAEVN